MNEKQDSGQDEQRNQFEQVWRSAFAQIQGGQAAERQQAKQDSHQRFPGDDA